MARILQDLTAKGPFTNDKGKVIYHDIDTEALSGDKAKAHATMLAAREAYAKAKTAWERKAFCATPAPKSSTKGEAK